MSANRIGAAVAGLVVLVTAAMTGLSALNGDVAYALGGIETAGRGGVSIWDVFVARPLAYRLLLGGLDDGRHLVVGNASLPVEAIVIRVETAILIVAVAFVLYLGVRRFLGHRPAAVIAGSTALALIVSPPWHYLQPDWVAPLAAVLAVGAACAPRQVWLGAVFGGAAAMLAVAVKLATAPYAILALVLVFALSPRRAVWTALSTGVCTVLWYVLTKLVLPWEWIWLNDQANLVTDAPIHHGIRWDDIHRLLLALGDVVILNPIVLVAPAAALVLVRRRPPGKPRWIATATAVVAAGLAISSAYGQGEFFMYHFAVVPVLAAAVWGAAFALVPERRLSLLLGTAVAAAASAVLLRQPAQWRLDHATQVTSAYAAAAVIIAVLYVPARRRDPWMSGAIVLCAALIPIILPGAPLSFSTYDYDVTNRSRDGVAYAELSERMGRDTPVLYLTFGAVNYAMGNPTSCRYPSPQWLQRGSAYPQVRTYPSYLDNLRCLTEDTRARFLVFQPRWFNLGKATPEVRAIINQRFDCSAATRLPAPPGLLVCPARV